MKGIDILLKYLNDNGVRYQVLTHVPAFSAHQAAVASHVPESELAKTLLVKAGEQHWMVVTRADQRVNEKLLKEVLEAKHVGLAHEEDLETQFPDCEVGAMPPFGNLYDLPVIMDTSLEEDEEIVFNACSHTESIKLRLEDYVRLVNPMIAGIAEPRVGTEPHSA